MRDGVEAGQPEELLGPLLVTWIAWLLTSTGLLHFGSRVIVVSWGVVLLAGDPSGDLPLSGLALADGFDETFAVYSPQMQALRMTQVQVTGTETVTTPAGAFETFVVTTTPQDGNEAGASTYYVTQTAPHVMVKKPY